MGKKIQSMWYSVFKKRLFGLVTVIQILAIFLSGCGKIASKQEDDVLVPEKALRATSTPTITPSPLAELIREVSVTRTPQIEQVLSGTITLWHSWTGNDLVSLQNIIRRFQKINPDVIINLQYVPFDDLFGKFTSGGDGRGPDVLIGPSDWGPELFDAELVTDVRSIVRPKFLEKLSQVALQSVKYNDAVIGLPIAYTQGIVLFRNRSILPEAPQTFEEYLEEARNKTRGDIIGAVIDLGFFQSGAYLAACKGRLMDARGIPLFDSASGLCWIDLLKNIKESGLPVEMNTNLDLERFRTGKVGFIVAGTWDAASLAESIGLDNLAIDPWPSYKNGDLSGFVETDAIYLSTQVAPENRAARRALVRYFLSIAAQNTLANPETGAKIPALVGVELQGELKKEMLAAFEKGTPIPTIAAMEYYWDPLDEAIRSILVDGEDPSQALEKAAIQIRIKENDIQLDELLRKRR